MNTRRIAAALRAFRDMNTPRVAAALVVVAALLAVTQTDIVRLVGAPLLVLALPGYTVAALLFPGEELSHLERSLIVAGTSLAGVIVVGLGLTLSTGLTGQAWTYGVGGLCVAGLALAYARRGWRPFRAIPRFVLAPRDAMLLVTALVIAFDALGVARWGVINQPRDSWTELSMVPAQGAVAVSVRNRENVPMEYRLVLRGGTGVIAEWDGVAVDSDGQWTADASVGADPGPLTLQLYRSGSSDVYRSVSWPTPTTP